MTGAEWMALLGVLGIGAILREIILAVLNRRKISSDVRISHISEVQQKVAVLEKIIERLEGENTRLEADRVAYEERERLRLQRIRDLEDEVEELRKKTRDVQRQLAEMREGTPDDSHRAT